MHQLAGGDISHVMVTLAMLPLSLDTFSLLLPLLLGVPFHPLPWHGVTLYRSFRKRSSPQISWLPVTVTNDSDNPFPSISKEDAIRTGARPSLATSPCGST